MSLSDKNHFRIDPRVSVEAMYTEIHVRTRGKRNYQWQGHVYDVSATGLRFELDEQLEAGAEIEIRATLPGESAKTTFRANGRIVRLHDDAEERGPMRMGMRFTSFPDSTQYDHLRRYVDQGNARQAA